MTSLAQLAPATIEVQPMAPAALRSRRTRLFEQASLALPLAGLGIGAWFALRDERRDRQIGLAAMGGSLALALARWQLARMVTETARYQVEASDGEFEIRHYASRVQAETVVSATVWEKSLDEGFHRLASYIFRGNAKRMKIAMTAPVMATIGSTERATRSVAFKMPDRYALDSLPRPDDPQIALRRVPARRVAALAFSGRYGSTLPIEKKQELLSRVRAAGLLPIGDVMFAGYDAPWTLPALRRNEVLVEISTLRPRADSAT